MLPSLTRRMRSWLHARLCHRADPVRYCAVVLRAEFHCDGDIVGSDWMEGFIHIRLPAWARICHYPGDNRDHLV
jgi:hypothetical protein